jgi:hypothetical protein
MTRWFLLREGRRPGWAALVLCYALLLAALCIGQAFAAAFVGQVVKARGDVRIEREGQSLAAATGTALQLGDLIKTGAGARLRLRFTDGSILALGENTQISIDIYAVDATNKSRTVVLTLLEGIVNTAAAKSGESQFDYQIKTANGYSAVRGTKWILTAHAGTTGLFVVNGKVELGVNAGPAKPVLVEGGNWGSITPQGEITPPQPMSPDMLKPLLDATADQASLAPPPGTVPVQPVPANPLLPVQPVPNERAFKNDRQGEKMGKDDHGAAGN